MLVTLDETDHILDKLTILLIALFLRSFLGILLQGPNCPKWHIRLLNLCNMSCKRLTLHKLVVTAHSSLHDQLKVVVLLNR